MKLKELKLKNFRGYKEELSVNVNESLTAFIGKNDIGKSTILEALEIFFNNKAPKIDNNDFNIFAEDELVEISCVFEKLPDAITIDSDNVTSLEDELLLNKENDLEIVKQYKKGVKSPSETIYLKANHPTAKKYKNILDKTNTELKKLAEGLEVSDLRKNAEIRCAIRENIEDLNLEEILIPVKKGDGKSIWEKLSRQLPLFALFKSDRSSSDQDSEVQDPLKLAVDMALREAQVQLEEIENIVKRQAIDIAQRTLNKMSEMNGDLVQELTPTFKDSPKWNSIFKLEMESDSGVPMNKRGSGMRRLVLLNFFRAEAERLKESREVPEIIFALEEPETSQHPSNQEMIIEALKEIAVSGKSQVLLTTHVPALASLIPLDSLRFLHKPEGESQSVIEMPSDDTFQMIADTLGVLPLYRDADTANAIVMVEGASDIVFLRHSSNVLKDAGLIPNNFEDKGIIPLISGGCGNLKHWITHRLVESLNKPYAVLLDSDKLSEDDPEGGHTNRRNIEELRSQGVDITFTRKREIENYLCPTILDDEITTIGDYDDVKRMSRYGSKVIDRRWPLMTAEMIQMHDVYIKDNGDEGHEIQDIVEKFLALAS